MQRGQTLLYIGCGWGELILSAAKNYGVKAFGITLSSEQYAKAQRRIEQEGLNDLAEVQLIDLESLREHYTNTLEHWAKNFEEALPVIRKNKDETFIRMWRLYLNSCAASFHCGNIDLHQFLFTKGANNAWPKTCAYMYEPYH